MNGDELLSRLDSIGWTTTLAPESIDALAALRLRGSSFELAAITAELALEHQPITLRGLFYRVVSTGFFPSTDQRYYSRLQRLVSTLRSEHLIPYSWIVDNLRSTIKPSSWSGLSDFADTVRNAYRLDFWASLDDCVHVFVEKDAMTGVIAPVTEEFDVPLSPVRGYVSDSFAHALGSQFAKIKKPIHCFYLGDFDPSGFDLERSLVDKLGIHSGKKFLFADDSSHIALAEDLAKTTDLRGAFVTWERLSLTEDDFETHNLIELEVKKTDTRASQFMREHGQRCAEVDALDPNVIRQRVREAITRYVPDKKWQRLQEVEFLERESWEATLGQFAKVGQ
ncbi:MAG: hypothetical protein AAGD07_10340 [Planctomycetota bacterium]